MRKISKHHTRVAKDGLELMCPHCRTKATVYHLAWSARTCQGCRRMVEKTDHLLPETRKKYVIKHKLPACYEGPPSPDGSVVYGDCERFHDSRSAARRTLHKLRYDPGDWGPDDKHRPEYWIVEIPLDEFDPDWD